MISYENITMVMNMHYFKNLHKCLEKLKKWVSNIQKGIFLFFSPTKPSSLHVQRLSYESLQDLEVVWREECVKPNYITFLNFLKIIGRIFVICILWGKSGTSTYNVNSMITFFVL